MAKLQLVGLTKKYDSGVLAVDTINLTVEESGFYALLGQEKSGKSTLLRMIAGLESVTEGDILLDGNSILDKPSKERDIAMFFQSNTLQQASTVFENIAYGLKLRKEHDEVITKKVEKIAEIVGVKHLLAKKPKAITTIERLKVILARAIVREPKLFLFDDPFANLTPAQKAEILQIVLQLQLRFGFTAIYATDIVKDAFFVANSIAVLQDGKLLQADESVALLESPANFYIADYLYNFNLELKECTLHKNAEEKYLVRFDNMQIVLPEKLLIKKASAIEKYIETKQNLYIAKGQKGVFFLFDEEKNAI